MKKFNKDKIEEWLFLHQRAIGWGCLVATCIIMVALILSQVL